MGADETEVDVHQEGDQRRQQEHVDCEEPLEGGWAYDRSTLEDLADESAKLRRWR
jgi:hypothetical protein